MASAAPAATADRVGRWAPDMATERVRDAVPAIPGARGSASGMSAARPTWLPWITVYEAGLSCEHPSPVVLHQVERTVASTLGAPAG